LAEFPVEIKRYAASVGLFSTISAGGLESFQNKANFKELLLGMAKA
jgi:hypothetical protein